MIFQDVGLNKIFDIPTQGKSINLDNFDQIVLFKIFDIPINSTLFNSWIAIGIIFILSWLSTRRLSCEVKVSRFQMLLEMIVRWIHREVKDISNDNPVKYLGLALGLFLFILVCNLLSIIPWYRPPTASLSTTMALASVVFLAVPYFSIRNAGVKAYLKKFIDPSPLLLPMNIFSEIFSIFALGLRLFGNMLSGVMFASILTAFLPYFIPVTMQTLGLVTGSIQAYIFALLAIVYTSNVAPKEPYLESKDLTI